MEVRCVCIFVQGFVEDPYLVRIVEGRPVASGGPKELLREWGPGRPRSVLAARFSKNYKMYSYVTGELPGVIAANFEADMRLQSTPRSFVLRPLRRVPSK